MFGNNSSIAVVDGDSGDGPAFGLSKAGFSRAEVAAFLSCVVPLAAFAFASNSFVIYSIARSPPLKTLSNLYLLSLALTDWLMSLLVMPAAAYYNVVGEWTLGPVACRAWTFISFFLTASSIFHLCAIAADRYRAITHPLTHVGQQSRARVTGVLCSVWTGSLAIVAPPYVLRWGAEAEQMQQVAACTIPQKPSYALYASLCSFYLPLALIVAIYVRLFRIGRRRFRRRLKKSFKIVEMQEMSLQQNRNQHHHRRLSLTQLPSAGDEDDAFLASPESGVLLRVGRPVAGSKRRMTAAAIVKTTKSERENGVVPPPAQPAPPPPRQVSLLQSTLLSNAMANNNNASNPDGSRRRRSSLRYSSTGHLQQASATAGAPGSGGMGKRASFGSTGDINFGAGDENGAVVAERTRMLSLLHRERRSVFITSAIILTFVVCWMPAYTLYLAMSLFPSLSSLFGARAVTAVWWLAYANSACNPVIYTVFNRDFNAAFRKAFVNLVGSSGNRSRLSSAGSTN